MKKQDKIYSIPSGAFGYEDIHIKPEDSVIVWLDNYGFSHVYYCIDNEYIQNDINTIKKQYKDFNSIKYVIVDNLNIKYNMTANVLPSPPDTIILPDDVLADIYNNDNDEYQDMVDYVETDYWVDQYKSGLMDIVEP